MSTGGDREHDGRSSPRPRYMAVQSAPPPQNGHRRIVGSDTTMTMLPGGHARPGAHRGSSAARGPLWAGMVALALCIVAVTLLLWALIAGAVWIVWRLAGG